MMEQVGEPLEGWIVVIATTLSRILREVKGQRTVGAEEAEEMHEQAIRPSFRATLEACNGGRRVGDGRLLGEPQDILGGPPAPAEARAISVQRLEQTHDGEVVVEMRLFAEPLTQFSTWRRQPTRIFGLDRRIR